jgi:phospholipase C
MRTSVRTSLISGAVLFGALGAAVIVVPQVGCSSSAGGSPEPSGTVSQGGDSKAGTGSVGVRLTLPGGQVLNTISWTITGPNGASTVVQTGSVNVQNSLTISFQVGGIPAANGYSISLTGTSTDGTATCAGSASFNVLAQATTSVSVSAQCHTAPADVGSVQVTATTFNCGTVNSITATPTQTTVGTPIALSASATAPNPSALTYAWSAPSGSFSASTAASTNFTCGVAGSVTLTLTVSDGPTDGGSCAPFNTMTVPVQCTGHLDPAQALATATPIKHVVVIFGENISFDHYFGTYPNALNSASEIAANPTTEQIFVAAPGTPQVNNLVTPLDPTHGFAPGVSNYSPAPNLLTANPTTTNATNAFGVNPFTTNAVGAENPFRLNGGQAATEDMGHNYKPEQQASDHGLMDLFPKYTGFSTTTFPAFLPPSEDSTGAAMAYFDGNTISAMWSYAQNYAINDNTWTTTFGPSTPGALNLISGQTNGIVATLNGFSALSTSHAIPDGNGGWTLIGDADPLNDICSATSATSDVVQMGGTNIGNLLNAASTPITWGWFEGGFNLSLTDPGPLSNGLSGCNRATTASVPNIVSTDPDYIQHHAPFQYYPSTANPTHARPTGPLGTTDPANHNYDTADFFAAISAGQSIPAVTYLKAPAYQDGHPGYSDPVDEQNFVTSVVTALQGAQEWSSTAIIITYDDSDGWYDHQAPSIVNPSNTSNSATWSSAQMADQLNGVGLCNSGAQQNGTAPTTPLNGIAGAPVQGRCGYGTRIPLIVISPFAKTNFVDHTLLDQSSVLRFIEDNWIGGQRIQPGGSFDTIANSIMNML